MIKIKNRRLNLGIVLIIVGLLWILSNLNIIDINLYNIASNIIRALFDLWPLILIIIGISFIFKKEILNTVLWGLFISILVVYSLFLQDTIIHRNDSYENLENDKISVEMEDSIEKGSLNLDIGATNFKVDMVDFEFFKLEQDGAFEYNIHSRGSIEEIYIKNKNDFLYNNKKQRNLDLALNKNIPWELDFDIGAISGDLNLKDLIIDFISIDMGAGDIELFMGGKNDFTSVEIDAGASQVILNVPRDVGLDIRYDGGLSSTNLKELNLIEVEENKFISKDYETFTSKYEIDVHMGVGNFEINYY